MYLDGVFRNFDMYNQVKMSDPSLTYLLARDLKHLKKNVTVNGEKYVATIDDDPAIFGVTHVNETEFGSLLNLGIGLLFNNHSAGILIANGYSFGLLKFDESFFWFNSHSTNQKGFPAADGAPSLVQCDSIDSLADIAEKTVGRQTVYTIDRISVEVLNSEPVCKKRRDNPN